MGPHLDLGLPRSATPEGEATANESLADAWVHPRFSHALRRCAARPSAPCVLHRGKMT